MGHFDFFHYTQVDKARDTGTDTEQAKQEKRLPSC